MAHSIVDADKATHLRIVATALAAASTALLVCSAATWSGGAQRGATRHMMQPKPVIVSRTVRTATIQPFRRQHDAVRSHQSSRG